MSDTSRHVHTHKYRYVLINSKKWPRRTQKKWKTKGDLASKWPRFLVLTQHSSITSFLVCAWSVRPGSYDQLLTRGPRVKQGHLKHTGTPNWVPVLQMRILNEPIYSQTLLLEGRLANWYIKLNKKHIDLPLEPAIPLLWTDLKDTGPAAWKDECARCLPLHYRESTGWELPMSTGRELVE